VSSANGTIGNDPEEPTSNVILGPEGPEAGTSRLDRMGSLAVTPASAQFLDQSACDSRGTGLSFENKIREPQGSGNGPVRCPKLGQ